MREKRYRLVLFWAVMSLQVLALGWSARANVVLKPKNADGVNLRAKSIEARVQIRGGFAQTTSVMTFANESSSLIEADFLSTLPDGAVATYFAYWFGEEKVVARIVEKERAAEIYRNITAPRGDPALVEMIGKNIFRVRIFPVMPNADLRVEMRWVQVLASTPTGLQYRFPLAPEAQGKGILDAIDLQIEVAPDASIIGASNNYRQAMKRANGRWSVALKQGEFQPTNDFVLNLNHRAAATPPPSLRAQIFAAPSSGGDGFFALAVTSNRSVKKPRLKIRGVQIYGLAPKVLPSLSAGKATVICGRYKGSGAGTIEVVGLGTARVEFGAKSESNHLATRLWAAQRLEDLSANEKNFETVLAVSHQFGLPSKWSSWLAVPKTEMERFQWSKRFTDVQSLGRRYVNEVARNGEQSAAAQRLKTQFASLKREADSGYELSYYVQNRLSEMVSQQAVEKAKVPSDARRVAQLETQIERVKALLSSRERSDYAPQLREARTMGRMEELSAQLVQEKVSGRANGRRARQLRTALESSGKELRYNRRWDEFYRTQEDEKSTGLAAQYVRNLYEKRDAVATAQSARQLRNLVGQAAAHRQLKTAREQWAWPQLQQSVIQLSEAQSQISPDKETLRALETKIARLGKQGAVDVKSLREQTQSQWASGKASKLYYELAQAKYVDTDAPLAQKLEDEIARVRRVAEPSSYYSFQEYSAYLLMVETKRQYDAQLRRENPDAKTLRELEASMARVYAAPEYKGVGVDWWSNNPAKIDKSRNPLQIPKIVELRTDYTNLDAQLRAQPNVAQRAQLKAQRAEKATKLSYATRYHLRLGDPLIAIDAPRDALQVVAVMPDGQIKRLVWNDEAKRWEARFDIPNYASEGAYQIRVIVVEKSGARRENTIRYNVDMTPPSGEGAAQLSAAHNVTTLRLEIAGSLGTARVFAVLPWDEKLELKLSPQGDHRFFALAKIPEGQSAPQKVTYILTDLAHNRTTIEVDVTR